MKKLLAIVVLGLLLSSNAYAADAMCIIYRVNCSSADYEKLSTRDKIERLEQEKRELEGELQRKKINNY